MNWNVVRLLTYLACGLGSLLALLGLADFDPATGALDIAPFNAYGAAAALAGLLSSGLAALALVKGWGRK